MNIKSFYINMRKRWPILPSKWNLFFSNLEHDYEELKSEFDDHDINSNEDNLRNNILNMVKED